MPFKRKYGKKKFTRKNVVRRRGIPRTKSRMATVVKKIVKKALDKRIENKEVCNTGMASFYQNGSSTIIAGYVESLSPLISQGVGENGRIGNSVRLKYSILRGYLRLNQSGAAGLNPLVPGQFNVRIFIGRLKTSIVSPSTDDLTRLLRVGASTVPFSADNGLSLCRTVNTELFTIYYDKIHKIGTSGPSQGASAYSTIGGISNNEYKLSKLIKINCTKMFKKNLTFLDTTLNNPTNTCLYMWGGIVDSIASTNSNVSAFVEMDYDLEHSFEDA